MGRDTVVVMEGAERMYFFREEREREKQKELSFRNINSNNNVSRLVGYTYG